MRQAEQYQTSAVYAVLGIRERHAIQCIQVNHFERTTDAVEG